VTEVAKVVFLGVGSATDFSRGSTSVLYLGSVKLLCDCGPSVPERVARHFADPELLDAVYISHSHGDHLLGLPMLLLWMRTIGRRRPLSILTGPGLVTAIKDLLDVAYPRSFAPDRCFALEMLEIEPMAARSFGQVTLTTAPTTHGVSNHALGVEDLGRRWAYSGDGKPTRAATELYRGVDLLVHECQRYDASADRGHAGLTDLVEVMGVSQPRQLAVVHTAPAERSRLGIELEERFGNRVQLPETGDHMTVADRNGG